MIIDVITLFPEIFNSFLKESILGRALANKLLEINLINLRDFATDKHKTVDDRPYGGGPGMVLKVEPLMAAIRFILEKTKTKNLKIIFLSPSGELFKQKKAQELSQTEHLILICGRYEGFDQRAIELSKAMELSIGDYILNGGEVAAMAIIEASARLIPGFMGSQESSIQESHSLGLLEHPHYTRPAEFENLEVPLVLTAGNHLEVARYRLSEALKRTAVVRPTLFKKITANPKILTKIKELNIKTEIDLINKNKNS